MSHEEHGTGWDPKAFGHELQGRRIVATSPDPIVSMVVFKDRLYLATTKAVYVKTSDDKFHPLEIEIVDDPVRSL